MIFRGSYYEQLFQQLDTDGNGVLDLNEFMEALKIMGFSATKEQVQALFNLVDDNFNGQLEKPEFCQFLYCFENAEPEDYKTMLFLASDLDHSGDIDSKELYLILRKLGLEVEQAQVDDLVASISDCEGGSLSYDVFTVIVDKIASMME